MKLCLAASGLLTLAVCLPAPAQHSSGGATSTPANASPSGNTDIGKSANWDILAGRQHGSLAFLGKVAVDGGQLPWDPVPVFVSCGGVTRFDTQTDSSGRFTIQAPATVSEIGVAKADPKHAAPAQLIGCTVKASLQGFQSSTVTIANVSILDNTDLGTLTLKRNEHAAGAAVSATTATAPPEALKAFTKARAEASEHHPDSAQRDLEKAVKAYPQFAEAWYQLGKIEEPQKPQDAFAAYAHAVAADPQYAPPYEHMAAIAATQKRWQDTVDATDHALKLDPAGTPQIWYFSAVGNLNLGNKSVAEASARTSLAMDPSHLAPNTEQLLAVMLAGRGDYAGALDHLRHCLTYSPPGPNADLMKQQIAQLEKLVPQPGN